MHFKDYLLEYINDEKYFISFYDNNIHIFNYKTLKYVDSKKISIYIENFCFIIEGENLSLKRITNNEILISGNIMKVNREYD